MKKIYFIICLGLTLSWSCEEFEGRVPYETFHIPEGKHSSLHGIAELEHEYLSYDVIFDESAKYTTEDPNNQADVNKLFGFSECNSLHEENSARFGWRWYEGELEILGYTHLDGDITISPVIAKIELNRSYRFNIYLYDTYYEFEIEGLGKKGRRTRMERSDRVCNVGAYYRLWPYFGGDETAPQDIYIYMRQRYDVP